MPSPIPQTPLTQPAVGSASNSKAAKASLRHRRRWWLITLLSFLFLCCSLMLSFHAYIAWSLARPYIYPLQSNPRLAIGLPYDDVVFPSRGGSSKLQGWYVPAAAYSTKTVIFSHGYGSNREENWVPIYSLVKLVHNAGYNALMFDYGYVQGNGRVVTGGIEESRELLGAIDYMKSKGAQNLFIWGFSMGAGTALQTALQERGTAITGMILDSTFLLNPDTLYYNMKKEINLPKNPSLPLIRFFFPLLNGVRLREVPYTKVESHTYPMPIFFIHGKEDERAPYETIERLFAKQENSYGKQLWLLPEATHELLHQAEPQQYKSRTLQFLQEHTVEWRSFSGAR
ncbi:alpha/beta hydrolase [Paenibacillus chartarius]|uniref:Alpha/beta hydrolase n=1 Tax=Paenibacillus chartarius TaxID=747481 RepID=A0ABV6DSG6_9BACL